MNPTPAYIALICLVALAVIALTGYQQHIDLVEQYKAEQHEQCRRIAAMNQGQIKAPFETYCSDYVN